MLYKCIYITFEINATSAFVVKPDMSNIINQLIKEKTGEDGSILADMMTYHCIEPIEPKLIDGYMQKADLNDLDIIAEYRANDLMEMNNVNTSKDSIRCA